MLDVTHERFHEIGRMGFLQRVGLSHEKKIMSSEYSILRYKKQFYKAIDSLILIPVGRMDDEAQISESYNRMKTQQKISMDISPEEYNQLRTRQLGNHHCYDQCGQQQKWNDARLLVLNPELFHNKSVLDVGCNEGVLTIPIAIKFRPSAIKGVDIDAKLIKKCGQNLDKFVMKNECHEKIEKVIKQVSQLPLYFKQKLLSNKGHVISEIESCRLVPQQDTTLASFPGNVSFAVCNILAPAKVDYYDTILCMRITKWIHLAFGDQAIKLLFGNLSSMLHEGGTLVLEVPSWRSYSHKKNLYPVYRENYANIMIRPHRFKEILKNFGLHCVHIVAASQSNRLKYDIEIFHKKGYYSNDYFI